MTTKSHRLRNRTVLKVLLVAILALVVWVAYDLFLPRTTKLREFNPDEVARLETAMWRSYYDRRRVRLFLELAELLRTQYRMPLIRSNLVAFYAAKAAFVFKEGKQRSDYEKALPDLVNFYESIREMSDTAFDVQRAARLELEWWIIHRERAKHVPVDLEKALAELQAEIYRLPIDRFFEHGRKRAEAMTIRDTKAEAGGVDEDDWRKIDLLLHESWHSLHRAVKL